jgi:hypothetical protein
MYIFGQYVRVQSIFVLSRGGPLLPATGCASFLIVKNVINKKTARACRVVVRAIADRTELLRRDDDSGHGLGSVALAKMSVK